MLNTHMKTAINAISRTTFLLDCGTSAIERGEQPNHTLSCSDKLMLVHG